MYFLLISDIDDNDFYLIFSFFLFSIYVVIYFCLNKVEMFSLIIASVYLLIWIIKTDKKDSE